MRTKSFLVTHGPFYPRDGESGADRVLFHTVYGAAMDRPAIDYGLRYGIAIAPRN